ncbi:hypothetical protein HY095_02430 [Candidatus Micrarchaeota archaeon]|nr:hypothetical protein [Candidatus Micrarchaeota archaeon]
MWIFADNNAAKKFPHAIRPDPIAAFGSLLEDFGIVKIALPEEAHVPFPVAMNGTAISFIAPDWMVWSAILFSLAYSAIKLKLV